jgi:molybdenum cofactor guanylyltransferase
MAKPTPMPLDANGHPPLLGLVLVGGRSSRMRVDKASLVYHGKSQAAHGLDLLQKHCQQAFLSCRQDQATQAGFIGFPQIHDTFLDMGPMSGILSALRAYPGAAFLVIACDLPLLDAACLQALVNSRDHSQIATAYAGPQNGLPEPLCAIYEPACYATLLQFLGQGITCPRKVLINSGSRLIEPPDLRALVNANDPEAYQEALNSIAKV